MKRFSFSLLIVIFSITLNAQVSTPDFGKVDKSDLLMTACDFDKDAEAMELFNTGEVYCFLNLDPNSRDFISTKLSRHVRIKIFNKKGLDEANIHIPYLSDSRLEDIKNLSAQTYNIDAAGNIVITKVDKSLIYHKKINKRLSEIIFTFPDVKPGSILEYKYNDNGIDFYAVKKWFFQKNIPVKYTSYILNFPYELYVSAAQNGRLNVNYHEDKKGSRVIKNYTLSDVPALRNEPFITCDEDYETNLIPVLQAADLPGQQRKILIRTWPGIIKELLDDPDFGDELKKDIPRTSDLDALLANIKDPYQKMAIIHDYVRKNMVWNDYNGIWALDGVRTAWKDKKGTTGEINIILIDLLKDAKLNVHPILVSTHENGKINTTIAGYDQFNKVMAYVEIDNKVYVLEATNKKLRHISFRKM